MDPKTLFQKIRSCTKCSLSETRTNVVIGRGSQSPDILFIGEGPGAEEDAQGKPFVGKSGLLLDRAIAESGIKNFAIINIIKCRPPENRKPTTKEIEACKPWLDEQILLLKPKIIVCLGATALNFFFPDKKISEAIGQTLTDSNGQRFVGLYHPSYCLRGAIPVAEYVKSYGRVNFFLADGHLDQGREALVGDPQPSPMNPPIPDGPAPRYPHPLPSGAAVQTSDSAAQTEPSAHQTQSYVPLHLHSEHGSIADVYRTDSELADDLARKGFSACAVTDHGSLSGLIYVQDALKAKGIKTIHGLECYINEGEREQSHMVLLVKNEIGYKNLLKLHTISKQYTHKIFNKVFQKLNIDEICKHSEGLICSTACISGALARRWKRDEPELVDSMVKRLQAAFGEDLYLETMPNRLEEQTRFNEYLLGLSKIYNIKLIITTDSHYNSPSDKKYHDIVKAISYKKTINDRIGFGDDTFCNLTTEEITELLRLNHPKLYPIRGQLFANTLEVAEKCNFEIPSNLGDTLIGNEEDARQNILDKMDVKGYTEKNGYDPQVVEDRMKMELDLIESRKFFKYFNTVVEMCEYADTHDIPRGPGRGSVGGSLVAYLLGITRVDPLRFNTLWQRFLSPTRTPDIDMDFSGKKREAIIGHLRAKFSKSNVSYIITYNSWVDKGIVRDVGRVYNIPLEEINSVTKELTTKTAETVKIEDALLVSEVVQNFNKKYPEAIDACLKLRGKIRHVGLHAAGVVICDGLQEKIPTELYDRADARNSIVTSWEKNALEKIGIVKFDVLGISVLDVIDECLKGAGIGWDSLPEDYSDPKVFDLLKSGKTAGIFQFGSQLVTDYLRHLNPNTFDDLVATNALCRPGPLNSGLAKDYTDRKSGKTWNYDHPKLEPITKNTLGIITFQEQIMQVANQIGNFSMVESEKFMKLIAKSKGRDALKEKEQQFYEGAISNGFSKQSVEELFNKILEFGRYSFNMSHSVEYSMLGYWTTYLKLYYPLAFYSSLVNNEADETQVLKYVKEATDSGVTIKPPSVKKPSERATFDLGTNTLYLGLNRVKGIGPEEIKKIIDAGKDFSQIKKVKKNVFETLVSVGYLDAIEPNRKQLLEGKELSRNTLWSYAENKREDGDWSEEEKLTRMRKFLSCWPRTEEELPSTPYDDKRKKLNTLEDKESLENKAFLSVGWVFDSKVYNNSFGKSIVLKYEDGTSRVDLNVSNFVYETNKQFIDDLIANPSQNPIMCCLHPFYQTRGRVEPRDGKVNLMWIGSPSDVVPGYILRGINSATEELKMKENLITNISYGTSKAGNKYCALETVDREDTVTNGIFMLKNVISPPRLGTILKGSWRTSDKGTFFRGE